MGDVEKVPTKEGRDPGREEVSFESPTQPSKPTPPSNITFRDCPVVPPATVVLLPIIIIILVLTL